jgi:hypothetical protein
MYYMITIQQTVNIPADRRLIVDLPPEVPSGKVSVVLSFPQAADTPSPKDSDPLSRLLSHKFPTIEEIKAEAAQKTKERLADPSRDSLKRYAGCLADSAVCEGDPVTIQRKMRDEWD